MNTCANCGKSIVRIRGMFGGDWRHRPSNLAKCNPLADISTVAEPK